MRALLTVKRRERRAPAGYHYGLALALLGPLLFVGCAPEGKEEMTVEARHSSQELYEKNKGVFLPPELRRQLGVATVEVAEHTIAPHLVKSAQVLRSAQETQPAIALALLTEIEAKSLRPGLALLLCSGSGGTNGIPGRLARLNSTVSPVLGQVEALVEFADPERRFPAGALLTATFTGAPTNALAVPESALVRGASGAFVYTASGEHFVRTLVKPGATADGRVEIMDGLYAGDVVVTQAVDALWLIELCALKGGTPCCPVSPKKKEK